jgi:hypothetical protein
MAKNTTSDGYFSITCYRSRYYFRFIFREPVSHENRKLIYRFDKESPSDTIARMDGISATIVYDKKRISGAVDLPSTEAWMFFTEARLKGHDTRNVRVTSPTGENSDLTFDVSKLQKTMKELIPRCDALSADASPMEPPIERKQRSQR